MIRAEEAVDDAEPAGPLRGQSQEHVVERPSAKSELRAGRWRLGKAVAKRPVRGFAGPARPGVQVHTDDRRNIVAGEDARKVGRLPGSNGRREHPETTNAGGRIQMCAHQAKSPGVSEAVQAHDRRDGGNASLALERQLDPREF